MTAPRKRILFVDDEPAILSALRNLLYKARERWEMVFVGGAQEALAALRAAPFDVVVSDLRMPGMDGAALLGIVRDEFPTTVRLMLSGYGEPEAVVRAQQVAHELLGKPCDPAMLRAVLERWVERARAA
jgi:DNA-binding NtrC family response regulator